MMPVPNADLARLLSLIAHEVRGPVGVMRGYLRMLDQPRSRPSERQHEFVLNALRAGDRAGEVLDQVSTLARLHRDESPLASTAVALDRLLHVVAAAVALPVDPAITLSVADLPGATIKGDEALLRSALTALATAVARAQPADTHLEIRAERDGAASSPAMRIVVALAGVDLGAHAELPLDLARGGLGLDLPIAAFVIDAHGGRIREVRDVHRLVAMVVWVPLA